MPSLPPSIHHDFSDGFAGWAMHDGRARLTRWHGRGCLALDGGAALAPLAPPPPYTAEVTLGGGPGECYVGLCFHVRDSETFEMIYMAPHAGGRPEAIQYDPVINGSTTWQVFGDADGVATAPLQPERWHRIRFDVWRDIAQVYVDGASLPAATFPLRSGLREGRVGLWGYLPCYAADFAVRPLDAPAPARPEPRAAVPPGTVREWLVAGYDEGARAFTNPCVRTAEHNGTLCLNRVARAQPGSRLYAACEFEVPEGATAVFLEAGYSDRARVWVDGVRLHEGEWRWDPATGADGRIRPGHVRAPLPPEPGRHTLLAEVTALEPGFGWGLTARVLADGRPCPWRVASAAPPSPAP